MNEYVHEWVNESRNEKSCKEKDQLSTESEPHHSTPPSAVPVVHYSTFDFWISAAILSDFHNLLRVSNAW